MTVTDLAKRQFNAARHTAARRAANVESDKLGKQACKHTTIVGVVLELN